MRRLRGAFVGLFEGGVCVALIALPPLLLAPTLYRAFVRRANGVLAQAAPIASQEASRALHREVRIGAIRLQ